MARNEKVDILIVGSGGREHSFGWAANKSPRCGKLYFAPGNGGTALLGENVPIGVLEIDKLLAFAREKKIDLVIVGPEAPLDLGICDVFRAAGIPIVGPSKKAAQLETSKAFAKTLMYGIGVPTAPFMIFDDLERTVGHIGVHQTPVFMKADGLCGGKGALPAYTHKRAVEIARGMLSGDSHGEAGKLILIEDFLAGNEVSMHCFVSGTDVVMAPATRDHKRLLADGLTLPDGTNPNTGGMGAFGPVGDLSGSELFGIECNIIDPVLLEMQKRKMAYSGILYPGIMMTEDGPQVLEFNVRGGDPESQVLMRLLASDPIDLFEGMALGTIGSKIVEWADLYAVTVTLAAEGYPDNPKKGAPILGIETAGKLEGVVVFHAGTVCTDGTYYVSGGRVLSVSAVGKSLAQAIERAYEAIDHIRFAGMQYRRDIGRTALIRL